MGNNSNSKRFLDSSDVQDQSTEENATVVTTPCLNFDAKTQAYDTRDTDLQAHVVHFFNSIGQTFRTGKLSIDSANSAQEACARLQELKGKLEVYRGVARALHELSPKQANPKSELLQ